MQFLGAAVTLGCWIPICEFPLPGITPGLTVLFLVGGANALNLLDGLNGLALASAALGFLPYNFPRGWLFMGDVGSLSLGFLLAGPFRSATLAT